MWRARVMRQATNSHFLYRSTSYNTLHYWTGRLKGRWLYLQVFTLLRLCLGSDSASSSPRFLLLTPSTLYIESHLKMRCLTQPSSPGGSLPPNWDFCPSTIHLWVPPTILSRTRLSTILRPKSQASNRARRTRSRKIMPLGKRAMSS